MRQYGDIGRPVSRSDGRVVVPTAVAAVLSSSIPLAAVWLLLLLSLWLAHSWLLSKYSLLYRFYIKMTEVLQGAEVCPAWAPALYVLLFIGGPDH
jgi:hypothetical protein